MWEVIGMRFGENCKVEIDSMNKAEARTFVRFLNFEDFRHMLDLLLASLIMFIAKFIKRQTCV